MVQCCNIIQNNEDVLASYVKIQPFLHHSVFWVRTMSHNSEFQRRFAQNVFQEKKQIHLLALVFAQNPEAQFWISLQRVTVSKASRQPAWWSIEHSLCASLSNRAHLSFPAQKKQQGKAEYFHNTPKNTGHILTLPHICSFLKIHHDPEETRTHYQSSCMELTGNGELILNICEKKLWQEIISKLK